MGHVANRSGWIEKARKSADAKLARARGIIARAEADLGPLTDGQRRDLLADNTPWDMEVIAAVVAAVKL